MSSFKFYGSIARELKCKRPLFQQELWLVDSYLFFEELACPIGTVSESLLDFKNYTVGHI